MRKFTALSAFLLFAFASFGQILNPVKWDFSSKPISDNEFELSFVAKIDKGWSVYSQDIEGDDGPIPTAFYFDEGGHYERLGKVAESPENRKTIHDPVFDMEVTKFFKKATFTQKIKVTDGSKPVTGYFEFMTCDASRCLPPQEVDFSFDLKPTTPAAPAEGASAETEKVSEKEASKPEETTAPKTEEEVATTAEVEAKPVEEEAKEAGKNKKILDPVSWSIATEKLSDTEYKVDFTANITKGWYVYSQNIEEDGPEPTAIFLDEDSGAELVGKADEISEHKVSGFDKVFEMDVTKFKESVVFSQKIKVADASQPISGFLAFMTCDDARCLPPADVPFKVTPATLTALIGDAADESIASGDRGENASKFPPITSQITIDKTQAAVCGEVIVKDKSLWGTFLLGIIGGLLALLTPCVWPMIPLTVSFFTKGAENKSKGLFNAFMYGFYILAVYVLLSVPFHLLDSLNPDILNEISTNTWLNVAFFAIFIFFAFSFFGYYEITLPSSWLNQSSKAEGIGGALGIFFMALTLALVSFSCTGPILGSLLAGTLSSTAGTNPATLLTAGMAGFGVALALPFGLFAAFPSWLNSLPKSGGWMTTVKVVLGFLELALALKFLSNADLVNKWGFLKIELFLGLWIVIAVLLGLYLIGKIRFPHDGPMKKIPIPRLGLAILSFAFAIYLAMGFRYDEKAGSLTSLTLLSGLAPPACYSWTNPCECPQNFSCFKDFYEGLSYAKEVNKPILIDFTGHACVNCRKMEETVWPTQNVHGIIDDNYVLVSLYVDEKIPLPEDKQVTVTMKDGSKRKLRNTGHQWQVLQIEEFNANTQPYYVLLSPDGKLLNEPVGYTPDEAEYANFLQCGLNQFIKLEEDKKLLGENR